MRDCRQFYIDGAWVAPATPRDFEVINPATEEVLFEAATASKAEVNKAVEAARRAFEGPWGKMSVV